MELSGTSLNDGCPDKQNSRLGSHCNTRVKYGNGLEVTLSFLKVSVESLIIFSSNQQRLGLGSHPNPSKTDIDFRKNKKNDREKKRKKERKKEGRKEERRKRRTSLKRGGKTPSALSRQS